MHLIIKIAWRNILRHKGKSLVIGIILFLGAYLMTLGNGVIAGMDRGLKDNIINTFMGHLVIVSEKQKSDNVLFEIYGKAVAPVHNFREIKKILLNDPSIEKFLPVGKNMALALNEESDFAGVFLLGVDFKSYKKMFPDNLIVVEGRLLNDNEKGVLVTDFARKECYNFTNLWLMPENGKIIEKNLTPEAKKNLSSLKIKTEEIFLGSNDDNSTTDVRTGIKGIIKYKALNTFWGHFLILDIESYRECLGYFQATDKKEAVSRDKLNLLNMDNKNLDALFESNDALVVQNNAGTKAVADCFQNKSGAGGLQDKQSSIKNKNESTPLDLDSGTYNMVFIKLKDGSDLEKKALLLDKKLRGKNLGARVITWKKGSGVIGSLAVIIKGFLFGFVIFLFLVAIIIIVNTLSMAALERISEIGMMRAIGAQKRFIRNMFIGETSILSGLFGGSGIFLGIITVFLLPSLNITTQNDMVQLLYGGDILNPVLDKADILITIAQLVLVTLLSVIYPVHIAGNITPLDAITRD